MTSPRRQRQLRLRVATLLDDDYGFVVSEDEALAESENDVCRCGGRRGDHEGPEGLVEAGKCRKFREMP